MLVFPLIATPQAFRNKSTFALAILSHKERPINNDRGGELARAEFALPQFGEPSKSELSSCENLNIFHMPKRRWTPFTGTSKTWTAEISPKDQRTYRVQTLILPGSPSSGHKPSSSNDSTAISCLVNVAHLERLQAALPAISQSIDRQLHSMDESDHLHEVRMTHNKGAALFAKRSIEEGQLIVWEHPAIILPSTDRDFSREIYEALGDVPNDDTLWQERRSEAMAMANEYSGENGCETWVEGVVRTNAVVLELIEDSGSNNRNTRGKSSEETGQKEIYGGIYPLINRANHR